MDILTSNSNLTNSFVRKNSQLHHTTIKNQSSLSLLRLNKTNMNTPEKFKKKTKSDWCNKFNSLKTNNNKRKKELKFNYLDKLNDSKINFFYKKKKNFSKISGLKDNLLYNNFNNNIKKNKKKLNNTNIYYKNQKLNSIKENKIIKIKKKVSQDNINNCSFKPNIRKNIKKTTSCPINMKIIHDQELFNLKIQKQNHILRKFKTTKSIFNNNFHKIYQYILNK